MKKSSYLVLFAAAAMVVSSVSVSAVDFSTNGSVRFRNQIDFQSGDDANGDQRNRVRLAFAYGVKAKVNDNVEAGFALATPGDVRSFNYTLGSGTALGQVGIVLDQAYLKHTVGNLSGTFGRFKNPFYQANQLIWDGDVRWEGAAFAYKLKEYNVDLAAAWLALDEKSEFVLDPNMIALQVAHSNKLMDTPVKGAVSFFTTQYAANNGAVFGSSELTQELSAFEVSGEADVKVAFVEMLKPYGQAVINNAASTNKTGFLLGTSFGSKKVETPGQWQFDVNYRYLNANAFVAALVDSDFLGGTQAKGWTGSFKYAPDNDLVAGITFRHMYDIVNNAQSQNSVQFDISTKF